MRASSPRSHYPSQGPPGITLGTPQRLQTCWDSLGPAAVCQGPCYFGEEGRVSRPTVPGTTFPWSANIVLLASVWWVALSSVEKPGQPGRPHQPRALSPALETSFLAHTADPMAALGVHS